jgi:hypothetical protein
MRNHGAFQLVIPGADSGAGLTRITVVCPDLGLGLPEISSLDCWSAAQALPLQKSVTRV